MHAGDLPYPCSQDPCLLGVTEIAARPAARACRGQPLNKAWSAAEWNRLLDQSTVILRRLPSLMFSTTLWKAMGRPFAGNAIRNNQRRWLQTPQPPLQSLHKTFTHGGGFWRDNYLLERWERCEQQVVYLGDVYNNYELKLRLGDWCWLTQDPASGY